MPQMGLSVALDSGSEQKTHVALAASDLELHLHRIVGPKVQGHVWRGANRLHHVREVVEREQGPHRLLGLDLLEKVLRDHVRHVVRVAFRDDLESFRRGLERDVVADALRSPDRLPEFVRPDLFPTVTTSRFLSSSCRRAIVSPAFASRRISFILSMSIPSSPSSAL